MLSYLIYFWSVTVIRATLAQPSWAKSPVRAPKFLFEQFEAPTRHWHYVDVHVGEPPQAQSLALNLLNQVTYLYAPNCTYCPYDNMYQPSLSSSLKAGNGLWNSSIMQAAKATESLNLNGLISPETPIGLIDFLSQDTGYRPREGSIGLFNHPQNSSATEWNFLYHLHKSGQILNPVVGIKLGGSNPSLSIGALDPSDYEGEINWVQTSPYNTSLSAEIAIPVEAIRGWNGNIFALSYPLQASLDSAVSDVYIPRVLEFLTNQQLLGPGASEWHDPRYPEDGSYFNCSITLDNMDFSGVNVPFSVDINGVNYPVDSKDLVRPQRSLRPGLCRSGIRSADPPGPFSPIALGLPFLRSVYVAYRFPTPDCPFAHYGFAFPTGHNHSSTAVTQQPRAKPEHYSQCLQLTPPSSKPSKLVPETAMVKHGDEPLQVPGPDDKTWKVFGTDEQVVLRGVDDLPDLVEKLGKDLRSWLQL